MAKIRVLVVDDHALMRDGIATFLGMTKDMQVVGEACNGKEALEKIKDMLPDVVLMDVAMPVLDGIEATRQIHTKFPSTKVLAVTQYDDEEYVLRIVQAGASGFITKTAASSELVSAVRCVCRGETFLSPSMTTLLIKEYQRTNGSMKNCDIYDRLTERERQVLKLIAEGHSNREIADTLVISRKTVEGHKDRIMHKLGTHSRIDLVKFALRKGLIKV